MTKPSTITDVHMTADEDSATTTFAPSTRSAFSPSGRRQGVRRSLTHTVVSVLTAATALTGIVTMSGGAALADSSTSGTTAKVSKNTKLKATKSHKSAKADKAAGGRRRPKPTASATPVPTTPVTVAPTTPPVTAVATTPPATVAPTKPPVTAVPTTPPPVTVAPTKPPVTVTPTKPPVTVTPTKPPVTVTPTKPPVTVVPTTPPATVAPTKPPVATTPSGTPKVRPQAGTPAGTVLKKQEGSIITKDGTVIDGADINGTITIDAKNVVIRRSKVNGDGMAGIYVRNGSLTLEDTTITGFEASVAGDNYTATRVEVTKGFSDGFKIGDNVIIQDSWCHDMTPAAGAHADCGQVQSGVKNATIRRNWFDVGNKDGNAALFMAPDLGPSSPGPLLVENNVLGGGNFTLQCVDGNNGQYFIGGITIRNNEFLRNNSYGAMRINVPATVTGNVYQDNKEAV
jgi:hypothetical protein